MQRTLLWKIALIGLVALLLFACLAAAMVATRRVDWYALGAYAGAPGAPAARKPA
jgi:inner membrane protein involved in colicin E2 resistance